MKQKITLLRSGFLAFFVLIISSYSFATMYDINVAVNSAQEVPPNASLGTGTIIGSYDDVTKVFSFTITFTGLGSNATASHFHGPAAVGVNAGVRIGNVGFPTGVTFGNYSNSYILTAVNEAELLGGLWYLNIHTVLIPGGEIRGQVYAKPIAVLELTSLLEGFYDVGINLSISDTLTVNLREGFSPYGPIESQKIFMKSNGNDSVKYLSVVNGTGYFIQILHRNALETWCDVPINFAGYYKSYDFSTSNTQAYGNNQVLKGIRYCLYSGDVNSDGVIDIIDLSAIDNDAFNFIAGYVESDVNGDNFIDLNDLSICDNNASNFVTVLKP